MGLMREDNAPGEARSVQTIEKVLRGEINCFTDANRFLVNVDNWVRTLRETCDAVYMDDLNAQQLDQALQAVGVKNSKLRDNVCKHCPDYIPQKGNLPDIVAQQMMGTQQHTQPPQQYSPYEHSISNTSPSSGGARPMWDGADDITIPAATPMSSAPYTPTTPPRRRGTTPPPRPGDHHQHHHHHHQQPHHQPQHHQQLHKPKAPKWTPQPKGFPGLQQLNNGGVYGFNAFGQQSPKALTPPPVAPAAGVYNNAQMNVNKAQQMIQQKMKPPLYSSPLNTPAGAAFPAAYPRLGGLGGGCADNNPIFVNDGGAVSGLGGVGVGMGMGIGAGVGGLGMGMGAGGSDPIFVPPDGMGIGAGVGGLGMGMGGMGSMGGCGGDMSPIYV